MPAVFDNTGFIMIVGRCWMITLSEYCVNVCMRCSLFTVVYIQLLDASRTEVERKTSDIRALARSLSFLRVFLLPYTTTFVMGWCFYTDHALDVRLSNTRTSNTYPAPSNNYEALPTMKREERKRKFCPQMWNILVDSGDNAIAFFSFATKNSFDPVRNRRIDSLPEAGLFKW